MAPSRTSTVKSKHAANKSGIRNSKTSSRPQNDGVSKSKAPKHGKGTAPLKGKGGQSGGGPAKKKRRIYTEKELNIPALNMITPVGVEKPKGGKKGKVFVDDRVSTSNLDLYSFMLSRQAANAISSQESMMTILAMVHADKEGQIESKMMKARQMEEIREARKAEADKRQEMRKSKLDETKEGIRKKRKRAAAGGDDEGGNINKEAQAGTKPLKVKRKTVSFA